MLRLFLRPGQLHAIAQNHKYWEVKFSVGDEHCQFCRLMDTQQLDRISSWNPGLPVGAESPTPGAAVAATGLWGCDLVGADASSMRCQMRDLEM